MHGRSSCTNRARPDAARRGNAATLVLRNPIGIAVKLRIGPGVPNAARCDVQPSSGVHRAVAAVAVAEAQVTEAAAAAAAKPPRPPAKNKGLQCQTP